jgi:hypothetical protein
MKSFPLVLIGVALFVLCIWIAMQFYGAAFGQAPETFEPLLAAERYTRLLAILGAGFGVWLSREWRIAFFISLGAALPLISVFFVITLAMMEGQNLEHKVLLNLFLMTTALPVFSAMGSAISHWYRKRKERKREKQRLKELKKRQKQQKQLKKRK